MHWSRGMQEGEQDKYTKVVSTGKHFVDYDQEGNGGVDRLALSFQFIRSEVQSTTSVHDFR